MQKILGIATIAAISCALPQLALAQSSSSTQSSASIQQEVKNNLSQAGFTNIRIMPESFLVRATDQSGHRVMMVINPDSVTEVTAMSPGQGNSGSQSQGQTANQSANTAGTKATQNIQGEKVPGQPNGVVAGLKQDESQGLSLNAAQRSEIWNALGAATAEKAPSGFAPQVGEAIPNSVGLKSLPRKLSNQVPSVKPYEYAMVRKALLIIDPTTKKIVAVITE